MTRYRAGLASAPISGFMVMYNKHTLSLEDLGTLEEQNWLNDQVRKKVDYANWTHDGLKNEASHPVVSLLLHDSDV